MTLAAFPIIRKASTAEATSLPSTTTLTMTTGSESADLSLLVSNASGTFSSSSSDELAKFSIATNNYTGYTLAISGSDDNGLLTNTDTTITTNNTFSSIDSTISETTFDTTTYNNKWGYKPSKYNSADNVSFRPAPTTTASTLDVTDVANTKKTEADSSSIDCTTYNCNDYTIGLGIRADYTKPVGTYTNTFILTATANPVGYSITYADNTGDSTVEDLPSVQAGDTNLTSVTLAPDSTPTRTGYTFRAWCSEETTSNGTICAGTEYTPGDALDFIDQTTASNAVTLYATWEYNHYYMQDFTATMCASKATDNPYTIYDKRDEQAYTVRYINGNCWMTRNIAIGCDGVGDAYGANRATKELTSADSNVFTAWSTASAGSTTSGLSYTQPRMQCATTPAGAYYNYCAVSAGTICTNANTVDATYSICPAGWKLPSESEFSSIVDHMTEFNPVASGAYQSSGKIEADYIGYWISSTHVASTNAVNMTHNFNTGKASVGNGGMASGTPARCIRNTSSATIIYDGNGATSGEMENSVFNPVGSALPTGTLSANTYEREGYVFTGWNTAQDGSGTSYADGVSYTASSTGDSALTLYAQWKEVHNLTVNFAGTGVESVVFTATGQTTETVSSSGDAVSLIEGIAYTMTANMTSPYIFYSWELNDANYGTLSSTTANPTTFTPNSSSDYAIITVTGRQPYCTSSNANCMQYYTKSTCSSNASSSAVTLTDARDGQQYTVRYINGGCWMTRNLAIGCDGTGTSYGSGRTARTLDSTYSNVSTTWSTGSAGALTSNTSNDYAAYMQCDSTYGAWYSYAAATVDTIIGYSTADATKDVCPSGWRLPTNSEQSTITNYVSYFNPVAAGSYYNGGRYELSDGVWWSATANTKDPTYRRGMYYSSYSLGIYSLYPSFSGRSVRCIKS